MSEIPYFEFQGVKYGIGTIIKYPITDCRWGEPLIEEVRFCGGGHFVNVNHQGVTQLYSSFFNGTHPKYHKTYINYIEIVQPVYYQEPEPSKSSNVFFRTKSGSWDAHNQVCVGLIWYIIIMLVACIFKDTLLIWIIATIIFFLWKSNK